MKNRRKMLAATLVANQAGTFNKPNTIEFDCIATIATTLCPKITPRKFVTYGSDTFVSFPIISTKLLSQSFFLSKLNFSTDSMIYENEMGKRREREREKKIKEENIKKNSIKRSTLKIKHNELDTLQMEKKQLVIV